MTQEDKQLLLKDLCARLPYKVKVNEVVQGDFTLFGLINERVFTDSKEEFCYNDFSIELIKPYLFPLSSMTEAQKKEYQYITERWMYDSSYSISDSTDWLNKHHFDYRGLIEKRLAIDATGLNIYQ